MNLKDAVRPCLNLIWEAVLSTYCIPGTELDISTYFI